MVKKIPATLVIGICLLGAGTAASEDLGLGAGARAPTADHRSDGVATTTQPAPAEGPEAERRADGEGKRKLSLVDAVTMALRNNADLRVESLSSTLSEEDVRRSRAIYDPVVTAAASAGANSEPHRGGTDKTVTASAGVTQLLPTGASVTASAHYGGLRGLEHRPGTPDWNHSTSVGVQVTQPLLKNAGRQATELSIVLAKTAHDDSLDHYRSLAADTVLSVVTTYNRLYALQQALDSRKASHEAAQKLLDTVKANLAAGTGRPIDVTNAEYGVVQRLKDLVDAERNKRDQEASLRYLVGLTAEEEITPTDPPTREEPRGSPEQTVRAALDLRLDLKQLRSALTSDELQERVAKHQRLPDLSLVVGGGVTGADGTVGDNLAQMGNGKGYWSAGLQVTMPIGNTAAESDYRKAKIQADQARAQIAALSWRIRNEVESDQRTLISARMQIMVAEKALEQATQRLDEYRKDNQTGTSTTQDVLNAEADLSAARSSRIEAAEAYADAVTQLWHDTGELLDHLGVTIATSDPDTPRGGDGG